MTWTNASTIRTFAKMAPLVTTSTADFYALASTDGRVGIANEMSTIAPVSPVLTGGPVGMGSRLFIASAPREKSAFCVIWMTLALRTLASPAPFATRIRRRGFTFAPVLKGSEGSTVRRTSMSAKKVRTYLRSDTRWIHFWTLEPQTHVPWTSAWTQVDGP